MRPKIQILAPVVESIMRHQQSEPGYHDDILMSIVDAELRHLAEESARYWAQNPEPVARVKRWWQR